MSPALVCSHTPANPTPLPVPQGRDCTSLSLISEAEAASSEPLLPVLTCLLPPINCPLREG